MPSNMYELKPMTSVPGLNVILPRENIRNFLITNNKIKQIKEPSEYVKGVIIDLKVSNEGFLILLSNKAAFESVRKSFKTESMDWYVLNGNLKNEFRLILLFLGKFQKIFTFFHYAVKIRDINI